MSINSVTLVGNLTSDPELRQTTGGTQVCKLRIAVNDRAKVNGEWVDKTHFFNVTTWAGQAENCAKYLSKGKKIGVQGRLEFHEWETDGQKRSAVEVTAREVEFLSPREDTGQSQPTEIEDLDSVPF